MANKEIKKALEDLAKVVDNEAVTSVKVVITIKKPKPTKA